MPSTQTLFRQALQLIPPQEFAELPDSVCLICRDDADNPVKLCCACKYIYCRRCIIQALSHSGLCPTCQEIMIPGQTNRHIPAALERRLRQDALRRERLRNQLPPAELIVATSVANFGMMRRFTLPPAYDFALPFVAILLYARACVFMSALFRGHDQIVPGRGRLRGRVVRRPVRAFDILLGLTILAYGFLVVAGLSSAALRSVMQGMAFEAAWARFSTIHLGDVFASPTGTVSIFIYAQVMQYIVRERIRRLFR